MEKGLRQGDPLAPFFFILAVEGLNVAFRGAQRNRLFKGVCLDHSNKELSLLQFVPDAIIMGEWDPDNARNLIRILKCFKLCPGLAISLSKCRLVGVSVSKEETSSMSRWLKCREESLLFKYLGLLVGGQNPKTGNRLSKNSNPAYRFGRQKICLLGGVSA